ncbi:MAG: nuclear transport factor 2 family protein [bacterium]|nr:nuclear transport factor 2 family protein [bacterium]MCP5069509.1 nuclear transport factor 2 family protein [bacterium]
MNEPSEIKAVRQVIEQYIEGSKGNLETLRAAFHPDARMTGYLGGTLLLGTPEPFFDAVKSAVTPESTAAYEAEIRSIEVVGQAATATLIEKGFLGSDFTDFFQFICENGNWRIISKTFHQGH